MTFPVLDARIAIFTISLLLAGCSGTQDASKDGSGGKDTSPTAGSTATAASAAAPPPPPCEAPAPAICAGPLVVSVENVTLLFASPPDSEGDRQLSGTATLVLETRSAQPIQAAMLQEAVTLTYSNGTAMTLNNGNRSDYSGLSYCGYDGVECVNNQSSPFTTISPGDSPLRVSLRFNHFANAPEIATLAQATRADLSLSLWVIETDPNGERRTVSVGNVPVQNGTVQ